MQIKTLAHGAAVLAAAGALAAPAHADSGGGFGYDSSGGAQPAPAALPSAGSLLARPAALLGRTVRVSGAIAGAAAGRRVQVQRLRPDGTWARTATTTTAKGGAFRAAWRARHIGRMTLRAVLAGSAGSGGQAAATSMSRVTVFKPAKATWFGPGFYGRQTACGQTLTRDLVGVAHRSLPCGTLVDLYYKGRTITAPVVDRGPFRRGTSWDLTKAAADALGFEQTDRIGAVSVRDAAPAARR